MCFEEDSEVQYVYICVFQCWRWSDECLLLDTLVDPYEYCTHAHLHGHISSDTDVNDSYVAVKSSMTFNVL